ncbi:PepSY-associated TM helix domain-containing protein [Sphingomonas sp.]|uniref:PepSY-associated TM helix domain-containing protein n=1 Tax=Sphingomonas sp. TaxID=28214 RepID=UPI003B003836
MAAADRAWLDRPFDHLATSGPVASPDAQVAAAFRAVPGGTLHKYVMPEGPEAAVRILVAAAGEDRRVYVDPHSLDVLKVVAEEKRSMRLIFHLHGELLAGAVGSYLVEIAACWAIAMLLAGLLYPGFRLRGRALWRHLHASAGIWVSVFALGLILTGLLWAKGWGSYLTEVRQLTGTSHAPVDWTIGGKTPKVNAMLGDHAGMAGW